MRRIPSTWGGGTCLGQYRLAIGASYYLTLHNFVDAACIEIDSFNVKLVTLL